MPRPPESYEPVKVCRSKLLPEIRSTLLESKQAKRFGWRDLGDWYAAFSAYESKRKWCARNEKPFCPTDEEKAGRATYQRGWDRRAARKALKEGRTKANARPRPPRRTAKETYKDNLIMKAELDRREKQIKQLEEQLKIAGERLLALVRRVEQG